MGVGSRVELLGRNRACTLALDQRHCDLFDLELVDLVEELVADAAPEGRVSPCSSNPASATSASRPAIAFRTGSTARPEQGEIPGPERPPKPERRRFP
jgi:hypothetical protein